MTINKSPGRTLDGDTTGAIISASKCLDEIAICATRAAESENWLGHGAQRNDLGRSDRRSAAGHGDIREVRYESKSEK